MFAAGVNPIRAFDTPGYNELIVSFVPLGALESQYR